MQILLRVEPLEPAALDRLGHRVAGLSGSAGLHLGHAEPWLQEQVEAAVGQQQRVLQDPGEIEKEREALGKWGCCAEDVTCSLVYKQSSCGLVWTELMIHKFRVECTEKFLVFVTGQGCVLLFQKWLKAFHALSDLLCVVQAEEGVLWGQLWQLFPEKDTRSLFKVTQLEVRAKKMSFGYRKGAYISWELAWSFCRSHTNSLYLLLTLEIFSVKHTLLVYTRRQKCDSKLNISVAGIETPLSPFLFYSRAGRFHSLCKHAKSRSSVCVGPAPRHWRPAAWMETAGETLELNALWCGEGKLFYEQIEEVPWLIKKKKKIPMVFFVIFLTVRVRVKSPMVNFYFQSELKDRVRPTLFTAVLASSLIILVLSPKSQ